MEERVPLLKNIGELKGTVLLFGGIYGNLQALEALQQLADKLEIAPQNIICTGDIAGYCAQPAECFALVQEWGIHAIAGNVELQLLEGKDTCGCEFRPGSRCDTFSRTWFPYVQSQTTDAALAQIAALPQQLTFTLAGKKAIVVHGSFEATADFIFASTPWSQKARNLKAAGANWVISGHCGMPFVQVQEEKCWLNAGVIGMPANIGSTCVWYALATPTDIGIEVALHPMEYDYQQAAALIRKAHLPVQYSTTLETGLWDNCEILPPTETVQQGLPIAPKLLHVVF